MAERSCAACSPPGTHAARPFDAWHAKETLRGIYRIPDRDLALETLDELARDLQDETFSPEPDKLGRTLSAWRTQITNWHRSRVTNGPTEAANNLAKLIKRTSFGITNFDHYRTRVLLYAGKPDWTLLNDLTPRQNAKSRLSMCKPAQHLTAPHVPWRAMSCHALGRPRRVGCSVSLKTDPSS